MDNQELGYFDNGLNRYIYHEDRPQMGGAFDDLVNSVKNAGQNLINQQKTTIQSQIKSIPTYFSDQAMQAYQKTESGQAAMQKYIDNLMANAPENIRIIYQNNKSVINTVALGAIALTAALIIWKLTSKRKSAAPPVALAANPRKKRKSRRRK